MRNAYRSFVKVRQPASRACSMNLMVARVEAQHDYVGRPLQAYDALTLPALSGYTEVVDAIDALRCIAKAYKTVPGVLKELTIFAIVYYLVRMVVWHSATHQHIGVERISFIDALRWLGAPSTGVPVGAMIINPIRPHRVEPRVKKRRPKSFPLMIKPRPALRQQLVQQTLGG